MSQPKQDTHYGPVVFCDSHCENNWLDQFVEVDSDHRYEWTSVEKTENGQCGYCEKDLKEHAS